LNIIAIRSCATAPKEFDSLALCPAFGQNEVDMRYESMPDVPHPENPEHEVMRSAAESIVAKKIEELGIDLDMQKNPELRARLAEIGSHFEDSLAMAGIIRTVYGQLRETLDLPDPGPERLMRAAVLHDIGKSGPAGAEGAFNFAVRQLFVTPRRRFNPYIDGRAKTIKEFVAEQDIGRPQAIYDALDKAGVDPSKEPMIDFWRRHAEWTYDILRAAAGPGVDDDLIKIAASHHLLDNQNPAHLDMKDLPAEAHVLEILEESELLAAVDKYQALRARGGSGHEEALNKLQTMITERKDLPETLRTKFLTVIDVLSRSKDAIAPYFEKQTGRGPESNR
jgi:hypothetical protein